MALSSEDNLRLNVLLRQNLQALRIDESKMIVSCLTDKGEGQVPLNPNCRDEKYLSMVREMISTFVLGSPIGYPVYIHRWTRMGQARKEESLQNLLKLGEPEAVVAVSHTDGLSAELARYAWWALPTEENARTLLRHQSVVDSDLGKELAQFLMEFLPFESEPLRIVETVSLLLKPGVLPDEDRLSLWKKASQKSSYYPGFLITAANNLPISPGPHAEYEDLGKRLSDIIEKGNMVAKNYLWLHSDNGQAFLETIRLALKRPSQQDVVVALFNAIGYHFSEIGLPRQYRAIEQLQAFGVDLCKGEHDDAYPGVSEQVHELQGFTGEDHETRLLAMLGLAQLSETLLDPIFGGTDCLGTVMRKRIRPLTEPLLAMVNALHD
jgi:hypothetical protein